MAGRTSKYYTHVKPRFNDIAKWCKRGASDIEIIKALGIGKSAFYDYLNKYTELSELIKTNRINPVEEIKCALYKRATGFSYKEKKVVTQCSNYTKQQLEALMKAGVSIKELGTPFITKIEESTKYALPDPASAMILLKHWAKEEGWTNDPQSLEIKKEELELKKEKQESEW